MEACGGWQHQRAMSAGPARAHRQRTGGVTVAGCGHRRRSCSRSRRSCWLSRLSPSGISRAACRCSRAWSSRSAQPGTEFAGAEPHGRSGSRGGAAAGRGRRPGDRAAPAAGRSARARRRARGTAAREALQGPRALAARRAPVASGPVLQPAVRRRQGRDRFHWRTRRARAGSSRSNSGAATISKNWCATRCSEAPTRWRWPEGTDRRRSSRWSPPSSTYRTRAYRQGRATTSHSISGSIETTSSVRLTRSSTAASGASTSRRSTATCS